MSDKNKEYKKERQWYAIHTQAGCEEVVVRYLKQRVDSLALNDKIFNVLVPKELKIKVRGGKRYEVEEKIYPGYVLVEMILDNETWYVVRNTPRVTGFVGAEGTKPTPLSKEEVNFLLEKMKQKQEKYKLDLKVNDLVKIIDGPFKDYEGKVSEVDEEKGKVKVLIPIFGRDTTIELDSLQVKRI